MPETDIQRETWPCCSHCSIVMFGMPSCGPGFRHNYPCPWCDQDGKKMSDG